MKKFYLCKLCLIVFGALLAVQSAVADDFICQTNQEYWIVRNEGIRAVDPRSFSLSASAEGGVWSNDATISHSNPSTAIQWTFFSKNFWYLERSGRTIAFSFPHFTTFEGGTDAVRVIHADCSHK